MPGRAVVLGASVAGLLAARLLSDVYEEVTLVERDRFDDADRPRRAVPQGAHIHGLLARGQQILEDYFPGLTAELSGLGVPVGDFGTSLGWYFDGRPIERTPTGLTCVSGSRWLLEQRIRRRVQDRPGVRILDGHDIVSLIGDEGRTRVQGVRVQPAGGIGEPETLACDLVVDASGRGSRTPRWLVELGYGEVPQERVAIDLTYATAEFASPLPGDPLGEDIGLVCVAGPASPRGGTLVRLQDRVALSLYGMAGERPPTDREGFLAYAKTLAVPEIFAAVQSAEMITDPVSMHFPANVRHRYELMPELPAGLLVLGDAACVFNPVYAQGMTAAAIAADVLRRHLEAGLPVRPQAFFRDLAAVLDAPWDMAAGGDLAFPGVTGRRSLKTRIGNAYVPRLQAAAGSDAHLSQAFLRVAGLVDPMTALMRPGVLTRVALGRR